MDFLKAQKLSMGHIGSAQSVKAWKSLVKLRRK